MLLFGIKSSKNLITQQVPIGIKMDAKLNYL